MRYPLIDSRTNEPIEIAVVDGLLKVGETLHTKKGLKKVERLGDPIFDPTDSNKMCFLAYVE